MSKNNRTRSYLTDFRQLARLLTLLFIVVLAPISESIAQGEKEVSAEHVLRFRAVIRLGSLPRL